MTTPAPPAELTLHFRPADRNHVASFHKGELDRYHPLVQRFDEADLLRIRLKGDQSGDKRQGKYEEDFEFSSSPLLRHGTVVVDR